MADDISVDRSGGWLSKIPFMMIIRLLGFYAVAQAIISVGTIVYLDYQRYIRLGPGGLPYNFTGYAMQSLMKLFSAETLSTGMYTDPNVMLKFPREAKESYLEATLPMREGKPPEIEPFIAPHRQSQGNPPALRVLSGQIYEQIVLDNPELIQIKQSKLEGHGPSVWLADSIPVPSWVGTCGGEILHIHPSEGSMHVTLSLPDAKEVIEKGWGQRHGLSGKIVSIGYLLIYSPRTEHEAAIQRLIMRAGIKAFTGKRLN